MGSINERIATIQSESGLSVRKFAETIGIAQPSARAIIEGDNAPSFKAIQGIAIGFPNISLEWLIRGEGEMLRNVPEIKKPHQVVSYMAAEEQVPTPNLTNEMLQRLIDERIAMALGKDEKKKQA